MPTYEYECKSCGYSFEAFQSMSEAPLTDCPQCKGEVRRLINGGSGIIFKCSGFYVTDKKGSGAPASKKPEAEGAVAEKTGQNGEPAPAAQPDPAAKERKGGLKRKPRTEGRTGERTLRAANGKSSFFLRKLWRRSGAGRQALSPVRAVFWRGPLSFLRFCGGGGPL